VTVRLLLLLPYAWDTSPSQRFRIEQWTPWLERAGVRTTRATLLTWEEQRRLYAPGLAGKLALMARVTARRLRQLRLVREADAVWLHRCALPVGPPWIERRLAATGKPIVFEFDDAIYLTHTAQANRRWSALKFAGKTAEICRLAARVVVGNRYLAEYARPHNPAVDVVPTTIDTVAYEPGPPRPNPSPVVLGWSGSGTTLAHLRTLDPVLRRVAERASVRLHVLGGSEYLLPGVDVRARAWSPDAELPELRAFDIGLMPLPDEEWARGKCALKALQYMALGIPTVTAPVGVNGEIIRDGDNGFLAAGPEEWERKLLALIADPALRERVGRAGRATVEAEYSAACQGPRVADIVRSVLTPGTNVERELTK
jgi:glycosyltransferase involved in cell wall biosynthesis